MEEQLISFETAKLAKEKGFNEASPFYYNQEFPQEKIKSGMLYEKVKNSEFEDSVMKSDEGDIEIFTYVAPTQSLLQKWLREKAGIFVFVWGATNAYGGGCFWYHVGLNLPNCESIKDRKQCFSSFEEALEKGLQEALKLIDHDRRTE
jgi:hypothetical protein